MMTTHPKQSAKVIRNCVLAGLLFTILYGGVYVSIVKSGLSIHRGKTRATPTYANHRRTQKILELIFWPAYQVDYFIRPDVWQVEFSDAPLLLMMKGIRD